jgi:hypothetical protein
MIKRPGLEVDHFLAPVLRVSIHGATPLLLGARGSLVVKAPLDYRPEGRGVESRWGEILNLPNPSGRTRPWVLLSL